MSVNKKMAVFCRLLSKTGNSRREKVSAELRILKNKDFIIDVFTIDEGFYKVEKEYREKMKDIVDNWYAFTDPLRIVIRSLKNRKTKSRGRIRHSLRPRSVNNPLNFLISFPDASILWKLSNMKKILSIIKKKEYSYIYTVSSPATMHLVGAHIKRKFPHIKSYLSYRDPWSNNAFLYKNPLVENYNKNEERKVLSLCDAAIIYEGWMPGGKEYFRAFGDAIYRKIYNSPYVGCDENSIDNILKNHYPSLHKYSREELNVGYIGSFYGADYGPENFLLALERANIESNLKIRTTFIGDLTKKAENIIKSSENLKKSVFVYEYMPFNEAIKLLSTMDIGLWIIGSKYGAEDNIPSKVFEYVYLGLPILSLIPPNSSTKFVQDNLIGMSVLNNDIEAIKHAILVLAKSKQNGELGRHFNRSLFSRKKFCLWFSDFWEKS